MGLKSRMEQIRKEYARYGNIKDTIKLNDGTIVPVGTLESSSTKNLPAETLPIKVLTNILERKKILEDIIAYGEGTESKEKEEELQNRLNKNDAYFMELNQDQKSNIKRFFEKAVDNLARTEEWQNYHMVYTSLQGLGLRNLLNEHMNAKKDIQEKKEQFEARKEELQNVGERIKNKYSVKDIKSFESEFEAEEKSVTDYLKQVEDLEKDSANKVDIRKKLESDVKDIEERIKQEETDWKALAAGVKELQDPSIGEEVGEKEREIEEFNSKIKSSRSELEKPKKELRDKEKERATYISLLRGLKQQHRSIYAEGGISKEVENFIESTISKFEMEEDLEKLSIFGDLSDKIRLGENDAEYKDPFNVEKIVEKYSLKDKMKDNSYKAVFDALFEEMNTGLGKELDETVEKLRNYVPNIVNKYDNIMNKLNINRQERASILSQIELQERGIQSLHDKIEEKEAAKGRLIANGFRGDCAERLLNGVPLKDYEKKAKELMENIEQRRPGLQQELGEKKEALDKANSEEKNARKTLEKKYEERLDFMKDGSASRKAYEEKKGIYNLLQRVKDAAKKAYTLVFEKTKPVKTVDIQPDLQKQADEWLGKKGLHAARHTNSKEFTSMMNALEVARNFSESNEALKNIPQAERPKSKEQALDYLKKQVGLYKKAKNEQTRIFKTTLRITRLQMADHLMDWADEMKKVLETEKELEPLNQYIESKGKENGKENVKTNSKKEMVTTTKEQKEPKESKEPVMEDDDMEIGRN